jgi:ABC-type multidrug transport system fused ATPase/permease subunit
MSAQPATVKVAREGAARTGVRMRRIWSLLRAYRGRVAIAVVSVIAASGATLAPPYLAGRAVDDVIKAGTTRQLDDILLILAGALVLGWFAGWAQTYFVGWVGQNALRDLRTRLFDHLQSLSVGFYDRRSEGVLISRLTNNVEQLDELVTDAVNALVTSVITIAGSAVVLFIVDVELALVSLAVIPLMLAGTWVYGRFSSPVYRRSMNTVADVTDYMEETFVGGRVVRSFVQEDRHRRDFDAVNARNRDVDVRTIELISLYLPFVLLASNLALAAVVVFGGLQVIDGDRQLGVVVSFIGYLRLALGPLPDVGGLYTSYQVGVAGLDQIFELLDERSEVPDKPGAPDLPPVRGKIELEHVHFGYGPERPNVLKDVSMRIDPDETVALVGTTGAGKSTIVKLLPRFYDPDEGRVLIDGHDIREVTVASVRRQIGYVPQEIFLFSGTVRENVAFAHPDATDEEIAEAARRVGVLDVLEALPDGLDTQVGERGGDLSVGQRQLVALARASLVDPAIIVLDEATASLDVATEARVNKALERLLSGRSALVVAHRLETVQDADRIVVLDAGKVVEDGTHEELLAAGGVYARVYEEWGDHE